MSRSGAGRIYRVTFLNQGEVYELYARSVGQGAIFGFVEIADLIFTHTEQKVIDPSRERLAKEFDGVPRTYIPMHSVLRIDEVERESEARILRRSDSGGRSEGRTPDVRIFPAPIPIPPLRD